MSIKMLCTNPINDPRCDVSDLNFSKAIRIFIFNRHTLRNMSRGQVTASFEIERYFSFSAAFSWLFLGEMKNVLTVACTMFD